ncbi:MAG TPA: GDP-mannose 4,6-dehydratase [Acidocella sp.]|nr:GDP-mannose 4,6-dehydratase [Acidocella sp.]
MGFWQGKNVLVTGATGFLGGWISRQLLEQGASLITIQRREKPKSQFALAKLAERALVLEGSLLDAAFMADLFEGQKFDAVFHLASMVDVNAALRDPPTALQASIGTTATLLEQIRQNQPGTLVVVASSDKAYGHQPVPYREDKPLEPLHPYEIAKATQDLLAQSYGRLFGLNIAVTRCGNFFGGYDFAFERIIPYAITQALRGQAPVLRSDGQFTRDFLYVEEAAAAHLLLAEKLAADATLRGEAFNFSHEVEITILRLVTSILTLMGSELKPEIALTAKAEITHMRLDCTKARERLGWQPKLDFEAGVRKTIAWYRDNQRAFS